MQTVGFPTVLITNAALPEPIAYTITKTVVENKDALVRGHAGLAEFEPQTAWKPDEGRHPAASGRRARLPREGVDEIAADSILVNGRILTLDPRPARRAALAVAGRAHRRGRRARATCARWRDRRTRVIDLRGATVIPGLVDAHAHLDREGLKLIYPSLARCRSIADVQALVRRLAARRQPRRVDRDHADRRAAVLSRRAGVPGRAALADARGPRRRRARPSRLHPRHLGLLEQAARLLGRQQPRRSRGPASRATRCRPPGVEIDRDAAGEPTGVFVERNLIQVLEFTLMRDGAALHATPTASRALAESQRRYAARGVTAVYEGHGIAPEVLAVYRESARARRAPPARPRWRSAPRGTVRWRPPRAHPASWRRGRAAAGSATIACAWPASACTTAATPEVARVLHEAQPYTGWAGFVESANAHEAYALQATLAARHGLRVNTLVTRCLPEVLDAWEAIGARSIPSATCAGCSCTSTAPTPDAARRGSSGSAPVATTNPISLSLALGRRRGGAARRRRDTLLPHRSLARHRIPFGLATDNKPADPWVAFVAVVARRDMTTGAGRWVRPSA